MQQKKQKHLYCLRQYRLSYQFGFTLIELLVVISVISMLASIILASMNTGKIKARDIQRVGSIKEVVNALMLYYDTHGRFPCGNGLQYDSSPNFLQPLKDEGFLKVTDIRDPGRFHYEFMSFKKQIGGPCGQIAFLGMYSESDPAICPSFGKSNVDSGQGVGGSQHCHVLIPELLPSPPCDPWYDYYSPLNTPECQTQLRDFCLSWDPNNC